MSSSTRGTTRKVLGSLAVIGTAAAVAGLGTFGTFTDSTTPVTAELASGKVSIDLAQPAAPIPAVTTGLLPGDSLARTLEVPAVLTPGGAEHLLLTLSLPTSADNTFQGKTSTLALTFSGVQRAATTR